MVQKLNNLIAAFFISVIPTLIIWSPFFIRTDKVWGIPLPKDGMATVVSNYDGPLYLVAAKTMYDKSEIGRFAFNLPSEYYTAHFPLFPLLIKLSAGMFGFPYAMLFTTLLTSVLAVYFFHLFISQYTKNENAWWLTLVFALFPARWLIVRSVGSPEPLFIAGIVASMYYFQKEKYLISAFWGSIAVLTKSPGILLFAGYLLSIIFPLVQKIATKGTILKSIWECKKYTPLLLMPISLIGVFVFYYYAIGDFWAYFHSGDNIHLFFPPFQIFNYSQAWVGTFWLEEVIFIYLIAAVGLFRLIRKKETTLAWFVGIFFTLILFVSHRDVLRYALPMFPFLMVAYKNILNKREFKYIMAILIIPIFLFSLAYISQNKMPIADWGPLL